MVTLSIIKLINYNIFINNVILQIFKKKTILIVFLTTINKGIRRNLIPHFHA